MRLQYFDAKPHYNTQAIRDIMWNALAYPNAEMLNRLLQRYHDDDDMRLIAAMDENQDVQALIGLKIDDDEMGEATVLHLRVENAGLHDKIGAAIIRRVIQLFGLHTLSSRAPAAHLPFYTELGFTNWVVGEKPRGVKWYGVRWQG